MSQIIKQLRMVAYIALAICSMLWIAYGTWVVYQVRYPQEILDIHSLTLDSVVAWPGELTTYTIVSTKYVDIVPVISRTLYCDTGKYEIIPDVTGTSPVGQNVTNQPSFIVPANAKGVCHLYWQAVYPPANRFQESRTYHALSVDTIEIIPCRKVK